MKVMTIPTKVIGKAGPSRRGSAYILILAMSMILTVIGLSSIAVARLKTRANAYTRDTGAAEMLAMAAVEQALTIIKTSPTWRDDYAHDVPTNDIAFGGGFVSFKLFDLSGDEDPASGDDDPVRVYGIGRSGAAVRVHSVLLTSAAASVEVFQTAVHAHGSVLVSKALKVNGGPLSTNGNANITDGGAVVGDLDAASLSGGGTVTGTQNVPAPPKIMPPASVFDYYDSQAAEIPYASLPSQTLTGELSATSNSWGSMNVNGVYRLEIPDGQTLFLKAFLLKGTLVISAGNASVVHGYGDVYAEPHRFDYPVLLVRGDNVNVVLGGNSSLLSINTSYPTGYLGLIHIIGSQSMTELDQDFLLSGTVISEGTVTRLSGSGIATVNLDSNLATNPPIGYTSNVTEMKVVAGSWRWETLD